MFQTIGETPPSGRLFFMNISNSLTAPHERSIRIVDASCLPSSSIFRYTRLNCYNDFFQKNFLLVKSRNPWRDWVQLNLFGCNQNGLFLKSKSIHRESIRFNVNSTGRSNFTDDNP